jgi:hypothetical protein
MAMSIDGMFFKRTLKLRRLKQPERVVPRGGVGHQGRQGAAPFRRAASFGTGALVCLVMSGALMGTLFDGVATAADSKSSVRAIRKQCTFTATQLKSMRKQTVAVEGLSLEGGRSTYFKSGRVLKRIETELFGETYRTRYEFCIVGSKVAFAYQEFDRYEASLGSPVRSTQRIRYYFVNGQLVEMTVDAKTVTLDDSQYEEFRNETVEIAESVRLSAPR